MRVAGVDACKRGWIAIVVADDVSTGIFASSLDELAESVGTVDAWAIDIPIGLPISGRRKADMRAREVLGPRRNSVFHTPVRPALAADTHAEASAISREMTGHGISQQAFALAPKIFEAEAWSQAMTDPVWEVHPEVSFAVMLGRPCSASKATWAGMEERRTAVAAAGILLHDIGSAGSKAGTDDVLDAAAAAWTAHRLACGTARSLPDPPEVDDHSGANIAIWA